MFLCFLEVMTADIKEKNCFQMKMFLSQIEFSIYKRGPQQDKKRKKQTLKNPFDKNHYSIIVRWFHRNCQLFCYFFGLLKKKEIPQAKASAYSWLNKVVFRYFCFIYIFTCFFNLLIYCRCNISQMWQKGVCWLEIYWWELLNHCEVMEK